MAISTRVFVVTTKKGSREFKDEGAAERYFNKFRDAKKETFRVIEGARFKEQTAYVGSFMDEAGGI